MTPELLTKYLNALHNGGALSAELKLGDGVELRVVLGPSVGPMPGTAPTPPGPNDDPWEEFRRYQDGALK